MADTPESSGEQGLKKTPLFKLHQELGAKLVSFAGYAMPVQFPAGIMAEHRHTRADAGLFDVSHMGQIQVRGESAAVALEKVLPIDCEALAMGQQQYTQLTNDDGGIRDDLIVTRLAQDEFFLVVNAACKVADFDYLSEQIGSHCELQKITGHALLALQGPKSAAVLEELAPEACELGFMQASRMAVSGVECLVSRSGYTGEDGFEIAIPNTCADAIARRLLSNQHCQPIGLGARDSLRLEAGLCLYGQDLNESTTPVEAGLSWSISKSRRSGGDKAGGFPGAQVILEQISHGAARKRVGLAISGRAPVREGAELFDEHGNECGQVTSGGFGPSVNAPIAMAYVSANLAQAGTQLNASLRNRKVMVTVQKMPFITANYHRK